MSLESHILAACLMECTAPKPGNVSPAVAFSDLWYDHFLRSAPITARWLGQTKELGIGTVVENAAVEIRESVGTNTHLGVLLLLAPLAASSDRDEINQVLKNLTIADAQRVYRAIRVMEPAGLGDAEHQDVHDEPTDTLLRCMELAADRDTIAKQYSTNFNDVYRHVDKLVRDAFEQAWEMEVVRLQLRILTQTPDTLIVRKCGHEVAEDASRRARVVLESGCEPTEIRTFDLWLREDGHRRNPGTTADMVAAVLFVALREGRISPPDGLLV